MVFTSIRIYYVLNLKFADVTYSSVTSTILGIVQLGIAVMVSSSALLRPVFDRTIGSWLGLSISTQRKLSGPGSIPADNNIVTIGRLANRRRKFQQMNSSEERLQWELTTMEDNRCERETVVQGCWASHDNTDIEGSGKTTVTKSIVVEC